jgi:hypothetical protein
MPDYRRALVPAASWFFTVNLLQRRHIDLLIRHIDTLREAARRVHRPILLRSMHGWCCPSICIVCGRYRLAMRIIRCVGG